MEATLWGLSASQFLGFAATLTVPVWGFVVLYVLALPLRNLPGVSAEIKYAPPKWILPALTAILTFALFTSLGAAATLKYRSGIPDEDRFLSHFQVRESPDIIVPIPTIGISARVRIERLEEYSYLRVFLNNRRLFGSHIDCVRVSQCAQGHTTMKGVKPGKQPDKKKVGLPLDIDITGALSPGANDLQVFLDNSGLRNCQALVSLYVTESPGKETKIWSAEIRDGDQKAIDVYETVAVNPSYRVCGRRAIRLVAQ
ncbi:hypothetical protein LJR161_004341 [Variovorax paradoxus]|uniref:Transmembrane protein n=1 Tax=Variovorax paradoxus TaxID=34073 RepID=A0AAW8ER30_VARPD|nr:hypothetical protein [Variovorax paradoxus]MDP9975268.1 hypothetical protein [Variovorax paradoxus]